MRKKRWFNSYNNWFHCYIFRYICEEKNTVDLNDRSFKVIYNANAYAKAENEKIRSEYAAMNLHDQDIIRAAKKETAVENAITAVKSFNVTPEVAAQKMNAPLDLVLERLKTEQKIQK